MSVETFGIDFGGTFIKGAPVDLDEGELTVVGFTFADDDIVQAAKNAGYTLQV